jgi:hypothetical protein
VNTTHDEQHTHGHATQRNATQRNATQRNATQHHDQVITTSNDNRIGRPVPLTKNNSNGNSSMQYADY